MSNRYEPAVHGETSREHDTMRWTWELAAKRDAESPCPPGAHWAPRDSIYLRDGISPRITDEESVERYRWVFDELPPITVQRGTYVLIDGRHRLEAAFRASQEVIRIREVDVADEDLAVAAFTANLEHGKPYTQAERIAGLKTLLKREPWATWSGNRLASYVGLARNTVEKYRPETPNGARVGMDGRATVPSNRGAQFEQVATPRHTERAPAQTRTTTQRDIPAPSRSTVATFDPGRDVGFLEPDVPRGIDPETGEIVVEIRSDAEFVAMFSEVAAYAHRLRPSPGRWLLNQPPEVYDEFVETVPEMASLVALFEGTMAQAGVSK